MTRAVISSQQPSFTAKMIGYPAFGNDFNTAGIGEFLQFMTGHFP